MRKIIDRVKGFIQKHPNYSAAAILGILVLIFVSPSFFQGRFLAPVNTFSFIAPYLDITTQMLPWNHLSAEIIHSGHFPFWNIFSGNGLPLMANMQSAIFFPLTWLFYIFKMRLALVLYSFLKLWLMGMFTFLYLRELKLSWYPSLIGCVLFAFCGANVIWFLWPLTSVILILPLSFLLLEKYFNTRNIKFALLLAPVTALGLFAGHPQTFFYIFMAIAAYTIFKSFSSGSNWKKSILHCVMFGAIYLLGLVISAVAVLPFLEYLKLSANLDYRAGFAENPFFLPKSLFLANLIPDFYGNTGIRNFSYLLVPNYGELALGYIGLSGFVLSLFAFGKKMSKTVIFFAITAILCLALVYHAPIIYHLINKLPGFSLNYNNRLLYLWAFCLSILAAIGLEKLLKGEVNKKQFNYTWAGFAFFAAILILINRLVTRSWHFANNLSWHTVNIWQIIMIVAFVINLALAYWLIKKVSQKKYLIWFFALVVVEVVIHGMFFIRTSTPANFYPSTPAFEYLQSQYPNGNYRTFTYGDNLLPNIGTWYHIDEINDHDTIYLKSNKLLKQSVANYNYSPEYTFDEPNLNTLRFLSVKYLLYPVKEGDAILQKYPNDLQLAYHDNSYDVLTLNNVLPRAYLISASGSTDLINKLQSLMKDPNSQSITPVNSFDLNEDGTETINYDSANSNYLITSDNYYPGWVASTGTVQDILGLRAVQINSGQGTTVISYHSNTFKTGLEITVAGLVVLCALFLIV